MVRLIAHSSLKTILFDAEFQFQNGAIDSIPAAWNHTLSNRFNSKMVRLIGKIPCIQSANHTQFQFQNGAIDSEYRDTLIKVFLPFQFQNGAIDSTSDRFVDANNMSFNSKMVRLIARRSSSSTSILACFNSKMVRLIGVKIKWSVCLLFCFNSKMVRLIARPEAYRELCYELFQFQNGAIDRNFVIKLIKPLKCFNSKMVRLIVSC